LIADHFAAGHSFERAVHWAVRAARGAANLGDIQGTIDSAERGLGWGARGVDRGLLLLVRGDALAWSGRGDARILCEALDELPVASGPWWLAVALLILAASAAGQPEQASASVRLAIDAPPTADHAGPYGQALLALVGGLSVLGKGELAATLLDRAAREVRPDADPISEVFLNAAHSSLAAVCPLQGSWRLQRAFEQCRASAAQMRRRIGALCGEGSLLNYFALAAIHIGRYEDARSACLDSLAMAEQNGCGLNGDWARVFLAKAQTRLGDPAAALATVRALESSLDRNVLELRPVLAAEAQLRLGRYEEAAALAERALGASSSRSRSSASCVLARCELALRRPAAALRVANAALELSGAARLESELDLLTLRAEALTLLGDRTSAEPALRLACRSIDQIAGQIDDARLRHSFLHDVEPCARARQLSARWSEGGRA
jgi:tetratricopeptide (TPR) repeat protein